jgi:hypothetical protein
MESNGERECSTPEINKETDESDKSDQVNADDSEAVGSEPKTPVVVGVEENVNSRFVDFSKVTPWEHLISDIERGIKALFQGMTVW